MKTDIIESKFDDGIYIKFRNLKRIDDFDTIASIIDKNIEVELKKYSKNKIKIIKITVPSYH